jgi:glycosyltransferase involved in cell wall biosynthesis
MLKPVPLSVIVCTYNRADYLCKVLASLSNQTLSKSDFEIVLIDDGSSDHTRDIVESFQRNLPINYFYQNNAGLASAKNHGIYASQGEILLFLDDDDVAAPSLLGEHIETHRLYSDSNYAALHYTAWSDDLIVTPLMHFITEIGFFLFAYPNIKHGDILDYTYFWGGRSSCKRSFLIDHGVFNPVFHFGCEDIELGYRLSQHGLKVVYNAKAVSRMIRPIMFDDFCRRLIKQGRSQYIFSTLHSDPGVHEWAEISGAEEKWNNFKDIFEVKIRSCKELDKIAYMKQKFNIDLDDVTKRLLYEAYWWAFQACKVKGIMEAKEAIEQDDRELIKADQAGNALQLQ